MDDTRGDERQPFDAKPGQTDDLATHRLPVAEFERICGGAVTEATMVLLEKTQYSQRKLALRALLERLEDTPGVVGVPVSPDHAWQILAKAERRDPAALAEILLYPPVGVWLTRALHHTHPDRSGAQTWPELGYLQLIVAAAAVRCDIECTIQVPVRHGVIALPTLGQVRLPTDFPIGLAEVRCAARSVRVLACDEVVAVDFQQGIATSAFSPTKRYRHTSRGLTLAAPIEDQDPYRGFGSPQAPAELDQTDLAEWRKMLDEAWDVLTVWHPELARELSAGLRTLVPIRRDLGIVGASSPAAFGGIVLSATGSAVELAETLSHELQHSKLNGLLGVVTLAADDGGCRFYAPWRDDPRPLTGLLHGIYAFTGGVEFMRVQRNASREPDVRRIDFAFAQRRHQLRQAINLLAGTDALTEHGRRLVAVADQRLTVCERPSVPSDLTRLVELITADHHALWRLNVVRPDPVAVRSMCAAWLDGAPAPDLTAGPDQVISDQDRALPGHRRSLLRTKALDPELFARQTQRPAALTGTTPRADAALCAGDADVSAMGYHDRLRTDPNDREAWVGLGLALHEQGRTGPAGALLRSPELTFAAHQRVHAVSGEAPDPIAFAGWVAGTS